MTHVHHEEAVVRLEHVSFSYPTSPIILNAVDLTLSQGWYGVVAPNGVGKSTLLRVISGELTPTSGRVHAPSVLYCAQEVEEPGSLREDVMACWDARAMRLRECFELDDADLWRWSSCSSGERKRWQLARALMMHPEVLLLDEPTNHLDQKARVHLMRVLTDYDGAGLIVSHDRELLDKVTHATIWIEPEGTLTLYPAPYSGALELRRAARAREVREREALSAKVDAMHRQHVQATHQRASSQAQISTRRRMTSHKDSDARSTAAKGRAMAAEKSHARRVTTTGRGLERAEKALADRPYQPVYEPSMKARGARAPHHVIAHLEWPDGLYACDEGKLLLEPGGVLTLYRDSRVWLRGPNGAGKTTLLEAFYHTLSEVHRESVLWCPQQLGQARRVEEQAALDAASREERSRWFEIAACLGVDIDAVRSRGVERLSPGSLRKWVMARGLMKEVWAMILDEPTNHLDLPAIEAMERALEVYEGALLMVTHDVRCAGRLTTSQRRIDPTLRQLM